MRSRSLRPHCSGPVLCSAFALWVALPGAAAAQETPLLQSPWQIEGIEIPADGSEDQVQLVIVGMGRAADFESPDAGGPVPSGDDLEWVTLLGTEGWAHASRSSIERRCEFQCSYDGPEECHWVGIYNTHTPLRGVGMVLAALPGRLDLAEYTPVVPDEGENLMARLRPSRDGEVPELLWSGHAEDAGLRVDAWDASAGRLAGSLVSQYGEHALASDDCRMRAFEWLLVIDCADFSVLASGGGPLLVSIAEYNSPKVEPLARFDYAGSRHYVVRLGAKAQDVIGLVSGEPEGWRARFRPRDWASLC